MAAAAVALGEAAAVAIVATAVAATARGGDARWWRMAANYGGICGNGGSGGGCDSDTSQPLGRHFPAGGGSHK